MKFKSAVQQIQHLDVVQGKNEERNKPYLLLRRVSTGVFDDAMRQKLAGRTGCAGHTGKR